MFSELFNFFTGIISFTNIHSYSYQYLYFLYLYFPSTFSIDWAANAGVRESRSIQISTFHYHPPPGSPIGSHVCKCWSCQWGSEMQIDWKYSWTLPPQHRKAPVKCILGIALPLGVGGILGKGDFTQNYGCFCRGLKVPILWIQYSSEDNIVNNEIKTGYLWPAGWHTDGSELVMAVRPCLCNALCIVHCPLCIVHCPLFIVHFLKNTHSTVFLAYYIVLCNVCTLSELRVDTCHF